MSACFQHTDTIFFRKQFWYNLFEISSYLSNLGLSFPDYMVICLPYVRLNDASESYMQGTQIHDRVNMITISY